MHSLIRLRHILAVARSGSFSIAAEEACISQPALSRSIQAFEADYGLRLFDRGKGGVTLTPAGALAVERARAILAAAGDFDRDMRLFGQGKAGRTGIGMGPMIASLLLPQLASHLLAQSPQLTLVTRIGAPEQMLEALLDGTIDLIIGNSWQLGMVPGVAEERLGRLPLAMVVRGGHPLAQAGVVTMRDLEAFPAAQPFDHIGLRNHSGALICENFEFLRYVVGHTDSTWLVSPALIRAELGDGTLVALAVTDMPQTEAQISLIHLRGRTRSPASLILEETAKLLINGIDGSNPALDF